MELAKFDFIIVGAGSAGCVLANRLSANPKLKVCLLEAGPKDNNPLLFIPSMLQYGLVNKVYNWNYWTEPQKYCDNRILFCPRGRVLGGSSTINGMCYLRGNLWDYDNWASIGNDDWASHKILPYFTKLEHHEHRSSNIYNSASGQIYISKPSYLNHLAKSFVTAAQEAGHVFNEDFNGYVQEGVGYFHVTQKKGKRLSNAQAYLHGIKDRKNLTIITDAHATKILFENKRATGIRFLRKNQYNDIYAHKEVILTAGAIGSPQLLLLSGVGPQDEIEKHGITLLNSLPGVGENFQDHLDIHVSVLEKTKYAHSMHPSSLIRNSIDGLKYLVGRKGSLTSNVAQAGGFIKSNNLLAIPDLQWHFLPVIFTLHGQRFHLLKKHHAYTLSVSLLRPKSRGRITLASRDSLAKPLINPNYLSNPDDLDAMVIGLKKTREVLAQPAFKNHHLKEFEPGEHIQTDKEIAEYIQNYAESIYHPVGTCKMGKDKLAVVDQQLKVYGLQNLRVIDASIMPEIISGNTNAATTMIAERGADFILQDLECR